jgi:hypothetical protein
VPYRNRGDDMNWRTILAVGIACITLLPATALASHMGQYVLYPSSHDHQGTILEPDGATTSVLGPALANCVVDLPSGGGFSGVCGDDAFKTGLGETIAPGCTGDDGAGGPLRRENGRCGLWTVGLRPNSVAIIPPGTVPAPISEQGMGAGKFPGRYSGTVRFLDGAVDNDITNNPGTGGPTNVISVGRYLRDAGIGNWILPGSGYQWAWYGEFTDRNGNGVVDACHATCVVGAEENEFVWLGNCNAFPGVYNGPYAKGAGFCKEDPNPNTLDAHECAPDEAGPCAGTTIVFWVFPGNHHAGIGVDLPGNQPLNYVLRLGDCIGPPTCDDDDEGSWGGDTIFGIQDVIHPDGALDDRTGDNGAANVGDDSTRQWAGYVGNVGSWYGDDGFLETQTVIYGANCAQSESFPWFYDLGSPAGTEGGCTFLDVDHYPAVNPTIEEALIGSGDDSPNGGLKGTLRSLWLVVAYGASVPFPDTSTQTRLIDSVENSETMYIATQGPLQGQVDDLTAPGVSREPNSPARTYLDAAGAPHTVSERYVGTSYGSCEALPVGDARNPTADADLISLEYQHRGFCNTGLTGVGSAYSAYQTEIGRGWMEVQPLRNLVMGTPITIQPPCTYCFFGTPSISLGFQGEPTSAPPEINPAEDHGRALGPGNYFFTGTVGTWNETTLVDHDESLFPDPPETTLVSYGPDNWIGHVVGVSGQWHYRGFLPRECTTDKDAPLTSSVHEAAECNPYLDGNVGDPQSYGGDEWHPTVLSGCLSGGGTEVGFAPTSGNMNTQIIVVRNYPSGIGPLLPNVGGGIPVMDAYGPGAVDALRLSIICGTGGFFTADYLVWPQGNLNNDIVTFASKNVPLEFDIDGDGTLDADSITDVDFYPAWRLPGGL